MTQYKLNAVNIDLISSEIDAFCQKNKVDKKDAIRLKFMAEEVLLHYADEFGECDIEFSTEKFFSRGKIRLVIYSGKSNPFKADDDVGIIKSLVATAENEPQWRYGNGTNIVILPVHTNKGLSNLEKIAVALGLGALLGFVGRMPTFAQFSNTLVSDYISPITGAYTGILCVMAILLTFFAFPLGIVQLGNTTAFHKMSKRILSRYSIISLAAMIVTVGLCFSHINFSLAGSTLPDVLKSSLDVLVGFVPTNVISPFLNFNCMQILIVGMMFGFSFLAMGEKSRSIVSAFDKINLVAVLTNNYLTKVIHIYVGMMTFTLIVTSNTQQFDKLFKFAPIMVLIAVLLPIVLMIVVCAKYKVKFGVLLKKLMPSFIINISSASVGASFITFFNELNQDCGVDVSYTTISTNVGTVLFKPMYNVFLSASALLMAGAIGINVSPAWIIMVLILSFMLSMAIPNIPGGAASVIVLMFGQLGFSTQICETVVSLNVLLQFIFVPVNIMCMQCVTLLLADKQNALNVETLRKPK